jgi:hypothetical protein
MRAIKSEEGENKSRLCGERWQEREREIKASIPLVTTSSSSTTTRMAGNCPINNPSP